MILNNTLSVFQSGLSFKQKSASYFPLLFAAYLLSALRGTHNQKAMPNLPQYLASGRGRSRFSGRGQRYNESSFTSSRAGRSSSAG